MSLLKVKLTNNSMFDEKTTTTVCLKFNGILSIGKLFIIEAVMIKDIKITFPRAMRAFWKCV